ncbi:MAG: T9SS type A sorting domain-containing protein [Saprospiraceae bacterium]|nr:T9SS type A sorting domain-containing protein [Saprospiraceae bacterium]
MKRFVPFILALLASTFAFAYEVQVGGVVVDEAGQGMAGVKVLIQASPNDVFQYENTVETNTDGIFETVIEVGDVQVGHLLFTIETCFGTTSTTRATFNRNKTEIKVRLFQCRPESECEVKIVARYTDAGEVILIAEGRGVGELIYEWRDGQIGNEIVVTEMGTYCVTLTDMEGCTATDCIDLERDDCKVEIHALNADAASINQSLILSARAKGRSPISYKWDTEDTTKNIRVDAPGIYCVTITDASGCTSDDCIEVDPSKDCKTEIKVIRPDITSASFALKLIARTKGRAPFKYQWDNENMATTQAIEVTTLGEYCVVVIDANGCESRACVTIDPRDHCKTKIQVHRGPNASDLQLTLTARTAGLAPFTYRWLGSDETTESFQVSELKEYCVEVIDAGGCISRDCIDLNRLIDGCEVTIKTTPSGVLIAQPHGVPPFKYAWSTDDTTKTIKVDVVGTICVTVTDALGCVADACFERDALSPNDCSVRIGKKRVDNGLVELIAVVKGVGDFTYSWGETGETTKSILVDSEGEYCVTVSNENCKAEQCVSVTFNSGGNAVIGGAGDVLNPNGKPIGPKNNVSANAFPNPFVSDLRLNIDTENDGPAQIVIHRIDGTVVRSDPAQLRAGWNARNYNLSKLPEGAYYINVIGVDFVKTVRIMKYD